jgi:hypothetical protein
MFTPLASFISFYITIILVVTFELPEALSTAVHLALAGLFICYAQSSVIHLLPGVRHWVRTSSVGWAIAFLATGLLVGLQPEVPSQLRTPSFLAIFVLPVAVGQTIALFRASYRAFTWPFLGAAPFLLLTTMPFGTLLSLLARAFIGATLSTIALWATLTWSSRQRHETRARPD